jgi:pyruvate, orthophosphate dikinase
LWHTQGDDVIAGVRTPMKLTDLRVEQPGVFDSLMHIERLLEGHYRDMQVSRHVFSSSHCMNYE